MRYKTRYPDSYLDGRVNATFTISSVSWKWLQDVDNMSAVVNDLILDQIESKVTPESKALVAEINKLAKQLKGFSVHIEREAKNEN